MRWTNDLEPYDGLIGNDSNYILTTDLTPYDHSLSFGDKNIRCTRPLYNFYQLAMIGAGIKQPYHDSLSIAKVYDQYVCYLILSSVIILSVLSVIISFNNNSSIIKQILESFWSYSLPLIQKGHNKKPFIIMYLFWLISMIPLIEILKNNLLANLVHTPTQYKNNLFDILKPESFITTLSRNYQLFVQREVHQERLFKNEFIQLKNRLFLLTFIETSGLNYQPDKRSKLISNFVLIDNENKVKYIHNVIKDRLDLKVANEKYWPKQISVICLKLNKFNDSYKEDLMKCNLK